MPRSGGMTTLASELPTIRAAFRQLATAFGRIAPILAAALKPVKLTSKDLPRKKPRLTATTRAALKLHGRYMRTIRGLKPRQQAKVKQLRAQKGIRAAIAAAESMIS